MVIADGAGDPIALCTRSASPHETKFVQQLIGQCVAEGKPDRLIGDKTYDSDPLFAWLQNYRWLVTRFDFYDENFLAFLKLAVFMILAKKYL